jgi:plastocyanin
MRAMLSAALVLAAGSVHAADIQVSMAGSEYVPVQITAKVGDTLVFNNDDDTNHMVFVPTYGFGVDLGSQKPGEVRKLALKRAGSFEVECVVHREMLTKVTVQP